MPHINEHQVTTITSFSAIACACFFNGMKQSFFFFLSLGYLMSDDHQLMSLDIVTASDPCLTMNF